MNKILLIAFCLISNCFIFGQDIIKKKDGESIQAKVELIDQTSIKYKKFANPDGPSYIINITEVSSIIFQNGTIENFISETNEKKKLSKIELQEFIVKTINEHGYEEDTFDRHYNASFEGDYLRLIVLRKSGKPCNEGIIYDFSNVYKFQRISRRSDKLAFINIFVSIAENKKKTKWDKHKLIMRVDTPENAELILNALKDYNSIVTNNSTK